MTEDAVTAGLILLALTCHGVRLQALPGGMLVMDLPEDMDEQLATALEPWLEENGTFLWSAQLALQREEERRSAGRMGRG